MKVKAVFELELEDNYYQEILEKIEKNGYCNLSSYFIVLRIPESFDCLLCKVKPEDRRK